MDPAVHEARVIGADGDETEIERPTEVADLGELRVSGQLIEAWPEFLHALGHAPISCVPGEPHGLASRLDGPGCPQGVSVIKAGSQGSVLGR